ncbi:hypothetical protein N0V90_013047 [Kalmusia sp. IMI 367209]|nr:hypothetical protein N0V90_013047 [Kalmusia sp. IMI 367209]
MPKGKPKRKFADLYDEEDENAKARRAATPQAKPHKRGGTHRVRPEHQTGTHWDEKNHVQLIEAAKEPLYAEFRILKKDIPKHMIARGLTDADRMLVERGQRKQIELDKLKEELGRQRQEESEKRRGKLMEKIARKEDRQRRRDEGDDVSISTASSDTYSNRVTKFGTGMGQIVSSDESDSTSTTATPGTPATISPGSPLPKLRLFEWSFAAPPSDDPPSALITPRGRRRRSMSDKELRPRRLPYAHMNVVTMKTGQLLETPGRSNTEEPDYVELLPEHIKDCARNGVLIGPLKDSVIESGFDWAERTVVQGWNGQICFNLPRRKPKPGMEDLAAVYREWASKERNRRMAAKKRGAGINKLDPRRNAQERLKNKRLKMLDVYSASEFRPGIVYSPSYLDAPYVLAEDEAAARPCSIENLFFIRLRSEKLPRYFFWADAVEWEDPTEPNPAYEIWKALNTRDDDIFTEDHLPILTTNKQFNQVRTKREPTPPKFQPGTKRPKISRYQAALWAIERDLYNNGWTYTMAKYRDKWFSEGKAAAWSRLVRTLVRPFPNFQFPAAPPVRDNPEPSMISIAEKMARVEVPSPERHIIPIFGNEDWTRHDDAYWITVWRVEESSSEEEEEEQDQDQEEEEEAEEDEEYQVERTAASPLALERRISDVFTWVDQVSSPYSPYYGPSMTLPPAHPPNRRDVGQQEWEDRFKRKIEAGHILATKVMTDRIPATGLQYDIWKMMKERQRFQSLDPKRCAICLRELGNIGLTKYESHLIWHMDKIPRACPFCYRPWVEMDGEQQAAHILSHRLADNATIPSQPKKRRSTPAELRGLTAVPGPRHHSGQSPVHNVEEIVGPMLQRRTSKVTFSPVTVERRVAYNDRTEDTGITSNSEPWWTSSKSYRSTSSNHQPRNATKVPRKSALKIDTSAPPARVGTHRPSEEPDEEPSAPNTSWLRSRRQRRIDSAFVEKGYLYAHDPRRRSSSASMHGPSRFQQSTPDRAAGGFLSGVKHQSATSQAYWAPRRSSSEIYSDSDGSSYALTNSEQLVDDDEVESPAEQSQLLFASHVRVNGTREERAIIEAHDMRHDWSQSDPRTMKDIGIAEAQNVRTATGKRRFGGRRAPDAGSSGARDHSPGRASHAEGSDAEPPGAAPGGQGPGSGGRNPSDRPSHSSSHKSSIPSDPPFLPLKVKQKPKSRGEPSKDTRPINRDTWDFSTDSSFGVSSRSRWTVSDNSKHDKSNENDENYEPDKDENECEEDKNDEYVENAGPVPLWSEFRYPEKEGNQRAIRALKQARHTIRKCKKTDHFHQHLPKQLGEEEEAERPDDSGSVRGIDTGFGANSRGERSAAPTPSPNITRVRLEGDDGMGVPPDTVANEPGERVDLFDDGNVLSPRRLSSGIQTMITAREGSTSSDAPSRRVGETRHIGKGPSKTAKEDKDKDGKADDSQAAAKPKRKRPTEAERLRQEAAQIKW